MLPRYHPQFAERRTPTCNGVTRHVLLLRDILTVSDAQLPGEGPLFLPQTALSIAALSEAAE